MSAQDWNRTAPSNPPGAGGPIGPLGTGLPVSGGLLAILVASAFLLLREGELQPSRPRFEAVAAVDSLEHEDVQARLWQDPFAAVARHRRELARGMASLPLAAEARHEAEAHGQLFGRAASEDRRPITVLGVMVFGGPYDEQAERRLRTRYAVLSALAVRGYEPKDSDHIGYFRHRWSALGPDSPPLVVPFEWFDRAEERLLVLWLDDDAFRSRPLWRLAEVVAWVRREVPPPTSLRFKLLGPNGSTNLKAMAQDLATCTVERPDWCRGVARQLAALQIFSPSATIARQLLPDRAAEESLDVLFRRAVGGSEGRFLRTIGTDEALAGALVAELELRRVRPVCRTYKCNGNGGAPKAHVALVSEWDTHYGRALPCAFATETLNGRSPSWCPQSSAVPIEEDPDWIHRFSYLRGFDGQVPEERDEPESERAAPAEADRRTSAAVERPVGPRRLDYLRRLGGQLRRLDQELRRGSGGGAFGGGRGLQAIGVLGSDVYDKLLILQALRDAFPQVIFFTTDLDASLLHPAEWGATRNLVVASSFGLELHRDLQGTVPAFRDNYQTSVFFSTRLALASDLPAGFGSQWGLDRRLGPRIFEIGRSGAFDLTPQAATAAAPVLHPPRSDHLARRAPRWRRNLLVAALGASALFLLLYWRFYRDPRQGAAGRGSLSALFAAVAVLGLLVLSWRIVGQPPEGEPFVLFDGISVWPSLLLRYLVAVLALYFVVSSWKSMAEADDVLFRKYLAEPRGGRARRLGARRHWPTLRGLARLARLRLAGALGASPRAFGIVAFPLAGRPRRVTRPQRLSGETGLIPISAAPRVPARELFRDYRQRGRLSRRLFRVIPLSVAYFALCRTIILLSGEPNVPARGEASFSASQFVTLGLAVPMLILLIFWVVDATKLSVRLARRLARCRTKWPAEALDAAAARLNLGSGLLGEWLDIRVIARHSVAVGRLVYAPVVVMVLMIGSRAAFFDNWDFPIGLCVVISVTVLYAILCAVSLRRAAEQARSAAVRRYRTALLEATGRDDDRRAEQIRLILAEITSLRLGAFVPFGQQPWVRAIALLFGGGGGLVLLEYLLWLR